MIRKRNVLQGIQRVCRGCTGMWGVNGKESGNYYSSLGFGVNLKA